MAKTAITGCFSTPLDGILGTRAKVGVLRVLSGVPAPLGYREIARRSGMAYRSIELAIKELATLGMLERVDGSRERLVALSGSHRLAGAVLALLRAEEDFNPALRAELRVLAEAGRKDGLLAVAIIGAGSRGRETVGEPLELLLLATEARLAMRWQLKFEQAGGELLRRFGVRLSLIGYDLDRARKLWRTRTPAAEQAIATAELLAGAPILPLLEEETET